MRMLQLRLPRWTRRFARNTQGVSAVEFALVLPLMLTLYLGDAEFAQAISASRKVGLVSRSVADLASQYTTLSDANMTNVLNASATVVAPFSSSPLKVTVSQIKIDANSNATIEWSDTRGGVTRCGASPAVPAALKVPNSWLIWGEAEYGHTPVVGYVLTGTLQLKHQMYMRPRLSNSVTRTLCP